MAHWFNSCRFFAPYYAINRLFKFEGKQWEEAFLALTTNHFFKGTLYVNKPQIYRLRPFGGGLWRTRGARKNLSVPLGVNIFGIFWKWCGSNYQSLHYFVLVNHDNTNFICFQSWSDGTTCKKPEKIVWTRNDIKLLGSLKEDNYTLVLKNLFGVNISTHALRPSAEGAALRPSAEGAALRPSAKGAALRPSAEGAALRPSAEGAALRPSAEGGTEKFVIRYLSEKDITELLFPP